MPAEVIAILIQIAAPLAEGLATAIIKAVNAQGGIQLPPIAGVHVPGVQLPQLPAMPTPDEIAAKVMADLQKIAPDIFGKPAPAQTTTTPPSAA